MAMPAARAVTEDELRQQIEDLKGSASDVESKKEELQSQLEQVQGQKDKAMQEKQLRDQELAYIDQQIANTESQIAYYDQLIEEETANLAEAQAKEEAQYELFCQRVRAMEEAGQRLLLGHPLQCQQLFRHAGQAGVCPGRDGTTTTR